MKRGAVVLFAIAMCAMWIVKYRPAWVGLDWRTPLPHVPEASCTIYEAETDGFRAGLADRERAMQGAIAARDVAGQIAVLEEVERYLATELPAMRALSAPPAAAAAHAAWRDALDRTRAAIAQAFDAAHAGRAIDYAAAYQSMIREGEDADRQLDAIARACA